MDVQISYYCPLHHITYTDTVFIQLTSTKFTPLTEVFEDRLLNSVILEPLSSVLFYFQ